MRKLAFVLAAVLGLGFLGGAALANDIPDGADCASQAAGAQNYSGSEQDRGAVCVSDGNAGNGAEAYVGGEGSAEGAGGAPCGAVIVAGATVAGDPDWDKTDNDPAGTGHCDERFRSGCRRGPLLGGPFTLRWPSWIGGLSVNGV